MSNPVEPNPYGANVPPAPGGQAFPPPNAGAPGAPGFPPPNAGAPGYPPAGGAPGYPPAPGAAGFPPAPGALPPAPKKSKLKSILGVVAVIVVGIAIKLGLGTVLSSDPTEKAKVGDCISVNTALKDEASDTDAKIVDCSSSDAKFTVIGRVEGVSDVNSTACDKFFKEGDEGAVLSSDKGKGYLLCVKTK
ncbi:hypothetical protein BJY16_002444 [Actinoplanes octamycinicus]|uniref:Uncharacterized protein n=1 Tax=Actinoplanes octamycinicus TaxID=135948 RepID=A0A7W7GVD7_9ACTN|nr:DUF3824 domain-containing protein [Actinoplanes octamycinicus]MBB4738985.1 hypothetical protein [Actinoplanes octamycinicus]GIE60114.1 hypothetical protein Aoc01nite_55160 [Actinoplanes octamycinicus]